MVDDRQGEERRAVSLATIRPRRVARGVVALALLGPAGCSAPPAATGGPASVDCAERASPAAGEMLRRFTGHAMGVRVEITIDEDDEALARRAAHEGLIELERLDRMLSDWKKDSDLSRLNGSGSPEVEVPPELAALLVRALEVAAASGGRFDPTVGPCVALWRASRETGRAPSLEALQDARARTGWERVEVLGNTVRRAPGVMIDFGGIGKGHGAVRALEVLRAAGCPRAMVAVAGDIAAGAAPRGRTAWTVAIEPEAEGVPRPCVDLVDACVGTSGGSAQWVEIDGVRRAHIVDPRTGVGASRLAQATVVGPLDATVDALGTALALCEDDAAAQALLDRFPGHRARLERAGGARWLASRR